MIKKFLYLVKIKKKAKLFLNKYLLIYSVCISLLELVTLYVLLEIVQGVDMIEYFLGFLVAQLLKVLIFKKFTSEAVELIKIENRIEFEKIKSERLDNIYSFRREDDKFNTEILAVSQEITNAKFAMFQKTSAITTILLYLLYGFYVEPYMISILILGVILYVTNKYVITRSREKYTLLISRGIDGIGQQLGIYASNLKFFLFSSHGNFVENRIHESNHELRKQQSKVNLINYASRPLLELIAVTFILMLLSIGLGKESIVGLVVIILKSVPLLAQINYSNATIDLAYRLSGRNSISTSRKILELNHWESISFTMNGQYRELRRGEKALIKGGSGSGKSTLMEMLAGITKPSFVLNVDGTSYSNWLFSEETLIYLNQQVKPWGEYVSDFVDLTDENIKLPLFFSNKEISRLREFGVRLNELSGGQFQRILLLKYLSREALIFIDEALSGLDKLRSEVIIGEMRKSKATVVLITHSHVDECNFDRVWEV